MATELDGVTQYSVDEVKQILAEGSAKVIDVRTAEEYAEAHIPGVPLKTMQMLPEWIGTLDPNAAYVFVCRSGGRSQKVSSFLKEQGFTQVGNCVGGMMAWTGDVKQGSEV